MIYHSLIVFSPSTNSLSVDDNELSKDQAVESVAYKSCNAYQGQRRLIAQIVIPDLAIIFQYFPTKLTTYRIHLVPFGVLDELLERNY